MSDGRTLAILITTALLVSASAAAFYQDEEGITGIASNARETKNGYVFEIVVPDGIAIKCFTDGPVPDEGRIVTVYGSFSDDGSIFFADKVVEH